MPPGSRGDYYAEDTLAIGTVTLPGVHAIPGSFGSAQSLIGQLTTGAPTGTGPTLNAQIEESMDGGATWDPVITFAQLTGAVLRDKKRLNADTPFGQRLRLNITAVGGTTPSFPGVTLVLASQTPQG